MKRVRILEAFASLMCVGPAFLQAQDADMWDISLAHQLTPVEAARIGGYDVRPPYVFAGVASVAVLPALELAVVDATSREVRVFGMDGAFRRRFGGRGDGPGEFRTLMSVAPLGLDRLLTWDLGTGRRFSLFTTQGDYLYSHPYEPPQDMGVVSRSVGGAVHEAPAWVVHSGGQSFVGVFHNEGVALREARPPDMTPGRRTDTVRIVAYDLANRTSRVLATLRAGDVTYSNEGGIGSSTPNLFNRAAVAAVRGNEVIFGFTGEAVLQRVSVDGDRLEPWTFAHRERPVSSAELDRERDRLMNELPGFTRERVERAVAYNTLPQFRAILTGPDAEVWVEDYPS